MSDTVRPPFVAMPYPGIARVTCLTPISGLPHVHVYMAQGPNGGLVLFDTAMPWQDSFERIMAGVEYMGRTPADIEGIYLTHAHPDHFGCAGMLQEASGAPVICHPNAMTMLRAMANPDPERFLSRTNAFSEFGWEPNEAAFRSGAPWGSMVFPSTFETIEEGDTVQFANSSWGIYWTPGHEEGHVVFHRPDDGVMIVGDTVLGKITPHIGWMFEPEDPLGQFLDSLEKVARLKPSLVLPGHGRPFEDGASRARTIASHHRQRLRRCIEIVLRDGPINALDIARKLFDRKLMAFDERLALAETLSHLEYLRLRGRMGRDKIDGIWHYELPKIIP